MSRPVSSRQVASRVPNGWIGVSDSASNSTSALRRARLSTIATSWPQADRCNDVGQPQKPSPPGIKMRKEIFLELSQKWVLPPSGYREICDTAQRQRFPSCSAPWPVLHVPDKGVRIVVGG